MDKNKCEIDFFLLGVSKAATSWIYYCFLEHPEIYVPNKDSLRYFDLKYHKGISWYRKYFEDAEENQVLVDPSPTYFRSPVSPMRIANDFPNAKFILCLRNPIDRAFSQFWHEKRKKRFDFDFSETLDNFLLYSWYIETGFYATHLKKFLNFFGKDRFKIFLYDELIENPKNFIGQLFNYIGVDNNFEPSVLHRRINQAGVEQNRKLKFIKKSYKIFKKIIPGTFNNKMKQQFEDFLSNKDEHDKGINTTIKQELLSIYAPEIDDLEKFSGLDLSSWKR